jgi:hypothetical protein
MSTADVLAPGPTTFSPEESGIPAPGAWAEDGCFHYCPAEEHVLRVVRNRLDTPQVLGAFWSGPVELAFDGTSLLLFGFAWKFGGVECWEGSVFCYRRSPESRPIVPVPSRTLRLELVDSGNVVAARRVVMPERFVVLLNRAVESGFEANDWHNYHVLARGGLMQAYPSPADLVAAVQLRPGGWAQPNRKNLQHCVTTDVPAGEAAP